MGVTIRAKRGGGGSKPGGMIGQPLFQNRVDAGLPAWALGPEAGDHAGGKSRIDRLFGRGGFRSAAQILGSLTSARRV
jgi:hypothetical protein